MLLTLIAIVVFFFAERGPRSPSSIANVDGIIGMARRAKLFYPASIHPLHSRSLTLCELRLINAFIKCEESVRVRSFVRLGNQRKIFIADADADATQPQPRPQSRSLDLSAESCRVEHVRQAHN